MDQLLFLKLKKIVEKCEYKSILSFEFFDNDFSEKTFQTAIFDIKKSPDEESYSVKVETDKGVHLVQGDAVICQITGQNELNWINEAIEIFYSHYEDEIRIEEMALSQYSKDCRNDDLGDLDRNGW